MNLNYDCDDIFMGHINQSSIKISWNKGSVTYHKISGGVWKKNVRSPINDPGLTITYLIRSLKSFDIGYKDLFKKKLRSGLSTTSFLAFCDLEYSIFLNSFLIFFLKSLI